MPGTGLVRHTCPPQRAGREWPTGAQVLASTALGWPGGAGGC